MGVKKDRDSADSSEGSRDVQAQNDAAIPRAEKHRCYLELTVESSSSHSSAGTMSRKQD